MLPIAVLPLLMMLSQAAQAQPVDQLIGELERQYQAKVISVQQRRGGYRVRLLQSNGVVKTIHYRPDNWTPPPRPRVVERDDEGDEGRNDERNWERRRGDEGPEWRADRDNNRQGEGR